MLYPGPSSSLRRIEPATDDRRRLLRNLPKTAVLVRSQYRSHEDKAPDAASGAFVAAGLTAGQPSGRAQRPGSLGGARVTPTVSTLGADSDPDTWQYAAVALPAPSADVVATPECTRHTPSTCSTYEAPSGWYAAAGSSANSEDRAAATHEEYAVEALSDGSAGGWAACSSWSCPLSPPSVPSGTALAVVVGVGSGVGLGLSDAVGRGVAELDSSATVGSAAHPLSNTAIASTTTPNRIRFRPIPGFYERVPPNARPRRRVARRG